MHKLAVLCLGLALLLGAAPATTAAPASFRGPWLLVSLASLGTVTWGCDPGRKPGLAPGLPALRLGFRAFPDGQTGSLRLRVNGRIILARVIQPGQSIELPYLRARVQRLEIDEGGEDGTLRASVTVTFATPATSDYCWPYMPPAAEVRLRARH